jgi:hypothetical protein
VYLGIHDIPQKWDAIAGRLAALSATDGLILETQGQGAGLRKILATLAGQRPGAGAGLHIDAEALILRARPDVPAEPPLPPVPLAPLVLRAALSKASTGSISVKTIQRRLPLPEVLRRKVRRAVNMA